MDKPIFVLGVGAQKSGTSWLHHALQMHASVDMGLLKEYHFWNDQLKPALFDGIKNAAPADIALRGRMMEIDGAYEAYFQGLIADNVRVTGDMTPGYCGLDDRHFALIKERLESAGFALRVVFLMRDPVWRNWSAARMVRRNRARDTGFVVSDQAFIGNFPKFYRSPQMLVRTLYDKTLESLKKTFSPDEIYVGFYESMFTSEAVRGLSDFLTVDLEAVDPTIKINASDDLPIPHSLYHECRCFYLDIYEYCFEKYPETNILWRNPYLQAGQRGAR